LYNILRVNFDGAYEAGYVSAAEKKESESMERKSSLEADIVVGTDGASSTVRTLLFPEVERTYVGYAAWRGTVKESLLEEETKALLGGKVSSTLAPASYHDLQLAG
jgi:2,6-dihydroxypyridine 3-monooxygenase